MAQILVIDDDPEIQTLLGYVLRREGHEVLEALNGEDALKTIQRKSPDLVVLDLMLPGMDGYAVCQRLRMVRSVPVLMLTGRAAESDKVRGLDTGADDYLTKPFSPAELLARVRALLRRTNPLVQSPAEPFRVGRLEIDSPKGRLTLDNREITVTRSELAIVACLAVQAGQPIGPRILVKQALNYDCEEEQARSILKVRISRLRQKLGDDLDRPRLLVSVRGVGYALNVEEPVAPS